MHSRCKEKISLVPEAPGHWLWEMRLRMLWNATGAYQRNTRDDDVRVRVATRHFGGCDLQKWWFGALWWRATSTLLSSLWREALHLANEYVYGLVFISLFPHVSHVSTEGRRTHEPSSPPESTAIEYHWLKAFTFITGFLMSWAQLYYFQRKCLNVVDVDRLIHAIFSSNCPRERHHRTLCWHLNIWIAQLRCKQGRTWQDLERARIIQVDWVTDVAFFGVMRNWPRNGL